MGLRWAAAVAALSLVVAGSPASGSNANAAAIQIFALASASVVMDDTQTGGGCSVSVKVSTFADFSEGVRVADVQVSWEGGGPPGMANQHSHPGKVMDDQFTFTFGVGGFKPGDYKALVRWQVHNGNGLSMSSVTVRTMAMTISENPSIVKLGTETKCEMEHELSKYANRSVSLREHADAIREGCPKCAAYLESVAAGDDSLAEIAASMAMDPPDPAFTSLPTAVAPMMPDVPAGAGIEARVAAAFRDLLVAQAEAYGQARAALSAIEKAQGAHLASDSSWETKQSLAAAGFLNAYAAQLERVVSTSEALSTQMAASGFPNPSADKARAQTLAGKIRKNGLPPMPGIPNWHQDQAKLTNAQLDEMAQRYLLTADKFGNAVTLRDALADPTFNNVMRKAADSLRTNASALTAQPLLNYAADITPSPAAPSPTAAPTSTRPATKASLVNNGGFDATAIPKGYSYQTLTAGKETLTGWRIEKGSIDIVSAGGISATGDQFIDLSGNNTGAGIGVIAQDIDVTPGHTYRLSFQLSGNPNGDPQVKTVKVTFGDTVKTFTFDTKGHTNNKLGWTTHTIDFASCGTSKLTIRFASQTEGSRGPNLDDIAVTDLGGASCLPVPLWLILFVVGLLLAAAAVFLFLRWHRKRTAGATAPAPAPETTDTASADNETQTTTSADAAPEHVPDVDG